MNTINPTQIAQTIHNEYDTPVDMDPEYEYETDLDLDQPIINRDQDYSFLCSFGTLTQEQKNQIEQLASKVNNKDLEFPFDYRRTTDFDSPEDAINYLQGIQYFYKVLFNDFNDPDFKTTNFWLERHHMHPLGLHGKNGGGKDEDDNLVRVPLAVHWLIHALHGDIAELLSDRYLAVHSIRSCQAIYRGVGTEERFYEFFKDVTYVSRQRLYDDVESSRKYWTKEKILESAKKYKTKKQWELAASRPYALAMQNKQLYREATKHMKPAKTPNGYWTKEKILESAKKYKTKTQWQTQEKGAYLAAIKNKQLFEEATAHMVSPQKQKGYWTRERILESAKKYNTKSEWKLNESTAHFNAIKNKQLFEEATAHMKDGNQLRADRDRKWTKDAILESAKKYQTKTEWLKAEPGAHNATRKNKQLFEEATAHMFKMPISNSNNWQPNITCLYYYLLTNPTLTEHEYLTNDKFYHSLKGKPRNRSTEIKNFFNKYKKEFEAWIQDQITKGIRELDHTNNRYVFTKIYQK